MSSDHIVAIDFIHGTLDDEALAHLETCPQCRLAVETILSQRQRQQSKYVATALTSFALHLLQGSAAFIQPILRQIPEKRIPQDAEVPKAPPPVFQPLRVLQPQVERGARGLGRFLGRFGLVLLLTIIVLLLPTPEGLSNAGHRALAVFVFTGSMLALEPVSLPIAALMVPLAQVALGVAETPQAFETFSQPVVFLILASLFLAEALRKHGLTRRLALTTIVASGGGISMLVLGLMLVAAIFSMWVENTATAAVLIPVALTISRQVPDPKKARGLLVLLVLAIAYSASIGGMATIMGAGSNAVAAGFLAQLGPWSFLDWMRYGLPAFLLILPLTWFVVVRLVPTAVERLDVAPVRDQVAKMGPMNATEREILITLGAAVALWVGGSFFESALGLPSTLLSSAMVAVMVVAYLAIRKIINWEDVKGVSWGIFLIIGAGLSLGEALTRTGVTDWFADLIVPLIQGPPLIISLMLLVYLSALLTNVMNNTTIAAVFVPILISLAQADPSINAVQLVLPVTLATTFGYSLPSASGRMSLIAASGIVERNEMMRYGLILTLVSSGVLGIYFYVLVLLNLI
jgi:sodium-dependent dicarboxylate transporter 2/3/5